MVSLSQFCWETKVLGGVTFSGTNQAAESLVAQVTEGKMIVGLDRAAPGLISEKILENELA